MQLSITARTMKYFYKWLYPLIEKKNCPQTLSLVRCKTAQQATKIKLTSDPLKLIFTDSACDYTK